MCLVGLVMIVVVVVAARLRGPCRVGRARWFCGVAAAASGLESTVLHYIAT